jgi:hypothetical protein
MGKESFWAGAWYEQGQFDPHTIELVNKLFKKRPEAVLV